MRDRKMVELCRKNQEANESIYYQVFNCLTNLVNMYAYKLTYKVPINLRMKGIVIKTVANTDNDICVNELFKLAFNLNKLDYIASSKHSIHYE